MSQEEDDLTQAHSSQGEGDDESQDLSQVLISQITPKRALPLKRKRQGSGMSPGLVKRLNTEQICGKCGFTCQHSLIWRLHKYKQCDAKRSNAKAEAEICSDFSKLSRFKDESCQLVCYVVAVHSVIMTGNRRYLLRATLADKNGRRLHMIWFFDIDRAAKSLGVASRVAQVPLWRVAVGSLHSALLRAVCINPIKIKRTEAQYKNPGNIVAVFSAESKIHPLDPQVDIPKIRPLQGAWGTVAKPLATIATDLKNLDFGTKYTFIGYVTQATQGTKTWEQNWGSGAVTSAMARGRVLLYVGEDESGDVVFQPTSWVAFLQMKPKPRAPWLVASNKQYCANITYVCLCPAGLHSSSSGTSNISVANSC